MKKIFLFVTIFLTCNLIFAQQEQQFTQFMYNKQLYNPAFAGSNFNTCATILHRSQWMSTTFEGTPKAQLVTFNTPLMNGRVGVGANIMHQSIGITNNYTMDAAYTYRFPVAHGNLGIGVQASVRNRSVNFSDQRLVSTIALGQDDAIDMGYRAKIFPNFGVGAYYNQENFYFGISVPRLINNNIGFSQLSTALTKEERHIYAMGGFIFPVSSDIKLQPQALLKYAKNSPFDAEVNLNAIYKERYTLGMTYRAGGSTQKGFGESLDFLVALQITDKFLLGTSYDYSLSELANVSGGSIELMLRYCFRKAEGDNFINPRFF
jgi:type IX secretion system PorP/SprF family membrane protein